MPKNPSLAMIEHFACGQEPKATPEVLAIEDAENRIQQLLMELEGRTGKAIDHVDVDTRNFAQLRTEITLRNGTRA